MGSQQIPPLYSSDCVPHSTVSQCVERAVKFRIENAIKAARARTQIAHPAFYYPLSKEIGDRI
jgi:hypothetical protein